MIPSDVSTGIDLRWSVAVRRLLLNMTYEQIDVLFEGKTLNEWNDMSDEELKATESYKVALGYYEFEKARAIENYENELATTDYPEYNDDRSWESRSHIKEMLFRAKERNPTEQATEHIKETLRSTSRAIPKGIAYDTDKPLVERGWAMLDSLGWTFVSVNFNGGHDDGGVESVEIETVDGEDIDIHNWGEIDAITDGCKQIWHNEKELAGLLVKRVPSRWGSGEDLLTPSFSRDNPLFDPIDEKWGGWAFNSRVYGHITWDNRKTLPNSRKKWVQGQGEIEIPIDDSKSMDEMIANPNYRKEPILEFEQTEMVSYTSSLDDLHEETRLD